jgi:hypothetical protein
MPHTRIEEFGDLMEVKEYQITPEFHGTSKKKKRKRNRHADDRTQRYRRADNLWKLAERFTRIVRSNIGAIAPPALVTLTMLEILGIRESYRAFSVFIQRLRARTKGSFRHIAVPEFQKRGAVHFHVLIWGLSESLYDSPKGMETEAADLRESINRGIQNLWQRGFADSISTDGSFKLAGYLAKYMRKAMHDKRLLGQKAYTASRNILRPVLHKTSEEFDDVSEYYLRGYDPVPLKDKEFMTEWLGKGRRRLFKKL